MSLKAVLLDLGGVVYVGDTPLPGAIAATGRLRQAGIGVRFLTNTTRSSRTMLLQKLRAMGLDIADEELFTPSLAARQRIEREGLAPHLLIHPALEEDFAGLRSGEREAVIVGDAGDSFSYAALNAAFRALDRGAEFLALANNRSFRDADEGLSLDAGPFVAALAFASRRTPVVLGKPAPEYFRAAVASMGLTPEEVVMIGDDAENDIAGAQAAGLCGILVQTGKYRPGDEAHIAPSPGVMTAGLADAVAWILAQA